MKSQRIFGRENPNLIELIKKRTGYSTSQMIHEGILLLLKTVDPNGTFEKEKTLRDAWENRIKNTEKLTSLLKELDLDLDEYRYSCIEGGMSIEEYLKIRTEASPELVKKGSE